MPEYVLVNRRSGLFTNQAKIASRASVQMTMGLLSSASVLADHRREDPEARHVMLLDADAAQVASIRALFLRRFAATRNHFRVQGPAMRQSRSDQWRD